MTALGASDMGPMPPGRGGWRDAARKNGVPEQEITLMATSIDPRLEAVQAAAATSAGRQRLR